METCFFCNVQIEDHELLCDDHAHSQTLPTLSFVHKCTECDHVVDTRDVDVRTFVLRRDAVWARLEREGETDNSPVVQGHKIIFYNSLCQSCKDWIRENEEEDCWP